MKTFLTTSALLALAACGPAPSDPVIEPTPAVITPDQTAFNEREPDLCQAVNYTYLLGQPGTAVQQVAFTQPFRVVQYRGIEAQEYMPKRVTFRLDPAGNIYNVDCG